VLPDDVVFSPISALGILIRSRQVSPVELTEAYLERLEELGPRLNSVATVIHESALAEARSAEFEIGRGSYRGALHGIPYGAKDLLATSGIRTTWGAPPCQNQIFDYDATVVTKLRNAGAILLGKLAMLELAGVGHYQYASASVSGPGLNPWNSDRYTGGSSSGSAAATAAGLVGFSIASETWGSILIPAGLCGVTGLRPTYGRVSRHGALIASWTMDKIGPVCRSVEDCAIVLKAIAGHDDADNSTFRDDFTYGPWREQLEPLRLGVIQENFGSHGEPEVEQAFAEAIELLESLGAKCEGVSLPQFPYDEVAEIIVAAESTCSFEELISTGKVHELADTSQQAGILAGQEIKAIDYLKAMRMRTWLQETFAPIWKRCDVLLSPTSLSVAPSVHEKVNGMFLTPIVAAGNILGLPAISLPCGFAKSGLPVALSIAGPAFEENLLLQIARAYQDATDWHRRRPSAFRSSPRLDRTRTERNAR
jgi:aspartyl-tRNA(Asn)/glutamyl-tRNA(Gln) amidotransferase subunit A